MVLVFDHRDDLGDDIAAALDAYGVADAQAQPLDLVCVVQGGAVTVMPPMETGASTATGVSLPVRPTWNMMSSSA